MSIPRRDGHACLASIAGRNAGQRSAQACHIVSSRCIVHFGMFRNIMTIHQVAHSRPWVMSQTWDDLLFAHWPVDPAQLEHLVRPPLRIDTVEDRAWLGVVTFNISRIQLRGLPVFGPVSSFPEVNLRTYVRLDDRPGVLFLSLHCPNRLAMALARPVVPPAVPPRAGVPGPRRRGHRVRQPQPRARRLRGRLRAHLATSDDGDTASAAGSPSATATTPSRSAPRTAATSPTSPGR